MTSDVWQMFNNIIGLSPREIRTYKINKGAANKGVFLHKGYLKNDSVVELIEKLTDITREIEIVNTLFLDRDKRKELEVLFPIIYDLRRYDKETLRIFMEYMSHLDPSDWKADYHRLVEKIVDATVTLNFSQVYSDINSDRVLGKYIKRMNLISDELS